MAKRKELNVFNIAFLDLLSGALGAVIILYIAVPKSAEKQETLPIKDPTPIVQDADPEVDARKLIRTNIKLEEKLKKYVQMFKESEKKIQELQKSNRSLATTAKEVKEEKKKIEEQNTGIINADVGFKFKGKHVIFIIDVSGSMYKEDRIGQVKAGLKMLITSMPKDFKIDVVQFPYGMYAPYRALWKSVRPMTKENKDQVYNFLHDLRPFGSTPTRDVMKFALKNYTNASDIVLLTDGAPTKVNAKTRDDIGSVLTEIQRKNEKAVQINSIGVGSGFLNNTHNDEYKFLKRLSEMHGGFFVGF